MLRKTIKKSLPELFDNVGSAQTEKELLARALRLLKANREEMEVQTGGVSHALTEDDIKKVSRASNTRNEAIKIIKNIEKGICCSLFEQTLG